MAQKILQTFVDVCNSYRMKRKAESPNLTLWKNTKESRPSTLACIYQFLALLYYFGIVYLPSKEEYWNTEKYMPTHAIASELGMPRNKFKFLWRHFHVHIPDDSCTSEDGSNVDCDSDDEDKMVVHSFQRIQRDQEVENINIESIDDEAIAEEPTKV